MMYWATVNRCCHNSTACDCCCCFVVYSARPTQSISLLECQFQIEAAETAFALSIDEKLDGENPFNFLALYLVPEIGNKKKTMCENCI